MVTTQDLEKLEFKNEFNPFAGKMEWHIGEETIEWIGQFHRSPIVIYDVETQTAKVVRSEFCIVSRFCDNIEEIEKFITAIKFLFNISDLNLK